MVVMKKEQWICFFADTKYIARCGFSVIEKELRSIFNTDLKEIVFTDLLDEPGDQTDACVFVKCSNYYKKVKKLKNCRFIINALNSFDDPYSIPEEEMIIFKNTLKSKQEALKHDYIVGDIVYVKSGIYKNLYGIVLKKDIDDNYLIFFKFFNMSLKVRLENKIFKHIGNFNDRVAGYRGFLDNIINKQDKINLLLEALEKKYGEPVEKNNPLYRMLSYENKLIGINKSDNIILIKTSNGIIKVDVSDDSLMIEDILEMLNQ